jgi:hypothetical protein
MDEMFSRHPWSLVAVLFGLPTLTFFIELVILAVA